MSNPQTAVCNQTPEAARACRLIGDVLMEQAEEWQLQHRYLPQHTMSENSVGPHPLPALTADRRTHPRPEFTPGNCTTLTVATQELGITP